MMLGLTLNYGVLISWAAMHGSLSAPGVLLYLAAATHTLFYDTVYSHQVVSSPSFSALLLAGSIGEKKQQQ